MDKFKVILFGVYPEDVKVIRGGVEASVFGLASQLSKADDTEVNIICYPRKTIKADYVTQKGNTRGFFLSNPYGTELLSFLRLRKIFREIKSYKPDVVHLHGTHLIDFLMISFLRFKKIKYVVTVHGILTVEHWNDFKRHKSAGTLLKYWIYTFFESLCIRLSPLIIVDTVYVSDWIYKSGLAKKASINVIPQGIDNKFYDIPDTPVKNNLLSIGSITERKGYEYAIKAVHLLLTKYPDISYYIAGFCQSDAYYKSLQELIGNLKIENNVVILKDIDAALINGYLSNASVFILHSQEESQGIVFCEAMAVGKPIVATNVGGIPYVVKNSVNGLLTEFGDIEAFSGAVEALLKDDKRRELVANTNKKEALNYNWAVITGAVRRVYNA